MVGNMKFRYYFSLIFFTVFAFGLSAQAVLKPETLQKLNNAVFEVVVLKPGEGNLEYEKKLPMERIPFSIRNDKYLPIGTAFLMSDGRFYSAAHVFNLYTESLYTDYYLRAHDGNVYKVDSVLGYSTHRDFIVFTAENYKYSKGEGLETENTFTMNTQTFSVGNALGEGIIIRDGLLTSQTFEEENGEWKWLRFSAAASPGNSGGPLVTPEGKVLGIITMKSSNENLNYALPFAETKNIPANTGRVHINIYYVMPNILEEKFFYEYNFEQKLPKKLAEVQASVHKDYSAFTANIIKDLKKQFDFSGKEAFTAAAGSDEIMYNAWSPAFPLVIMRQDNKKWDLFLPKDISDYKLPQNGKVSFGQMLGAVMAVIKKPDNITEKELIASPKLYMDYVLSASRIYRTIGSERVAVTSFGKPDRSHTHIDVYGRTWLVNYWPLPFADAEVISYALPIPGGIYVISRIDSVSSIRNGHNLDFAFISDYIMPRYMASFGDWKEFLSLSVKDYPLDPALSSVTFDFDKAATSIKAGDYDLSVPQKVFASDKESTLRLGLGFYMKDNKPHLDIQDLFMYTNTRSDDYRYIALAKSRNPPEDAPQGMLDRWQQKAEQAAPFNAKPYNNDQYTYYNEILFSANIKETKALTHLYYMSLELKQQNKFEEIKAFAGEVKKGLKQPDR
jgi:hypothetical protein